MIPSSCFILAIRFFFLLSSFRIAVLCTQKMSSSVFSRLCGFSFVYAPVKNRSFLNINVH